MNIVNDYLWVQLPTTMIPFLVEGYVSDYRQMTHREKRIKLNVTLINRRDSVKRFMRCIIFQKDSFSDLPEPMPPLIAPILNLELLKLITVNLSLGIPLSDLKVKEHKLVTQLAYQNANGDESSTHSYNIIHKDGKNIVSYYKVTL